MKTLTLSLLAGLLSITVTASHAQEQDTELNNIELDEEITDEQIRDYMKQRQEYQDDPAALKILDRIQEAAGITEADIARAQGREPGSDAGAATAGATAGTSTGESAAASADHQEHAIQGNPQESEPEFEPDPALAENAYLHGDYKTALKHYNELAKEGDPHAHLILGIMHQEGQAVEQDPTKARAYYQRAADYGDRRGQELAESLEIYMDETKIENSQEQYNKLVEEQKEAGAPEPEPPSGQKWDRGPVTEGGRPALPSVD